MQLVPAVTELMVAELLYLEKQGPVLPIEMLINSSGTTRQDGEIVSAAPHACRPVKSSQLRVCNRAQRSFTDGGACTLFLQLSFDSEGIALTSTMGFVKNPVRDGSHNSYGSNCDHTATEATASRQPSVTQTCAMHAHVER